MNREHLVDNCRLLRNLNTNIDEEGLMRSISQLSNEVDKIESASGRSQRTIKMRNEIGKLEDQLSYCKIQSKNRTRQYHNTIPEV